MVSGKYSALSGAIAKEQAMGNIASNLANASTTGFKKDRISFEAILRGTQQSTDAGGINFARIRNIGTDFSQGGMQPTGRSLDVAIEGEGFFKVQKNNEFFYTRAGRLMINENGLITTDNGFAVLGAANEPLQIDTTAGKDIVIADTGDISVNGAPAEGKIQVFNVSDPAKLRKTGDSLYKLEDGETDQALETSQVVQGSLETSNVNMMEEMVAMIAAQRSFEAHHKAIESYSKLGDKLDELGSVG